ncbi:MAG: hypothetical protein Q9195_001053 [Heterodermia aff. obscurata]
MQAYTSDEDIFFFGFSRGAYVARFLAEMLDQVGLLSVGNEEMARFAWKAFSQWQQRQEGTEEEKKKKSEMFDFLQNFRETFSRPVRRIRFMGLFDTVNSVPRFENAWMQRSKFPYTARSSAKVIRHAVSIDERRAKFRSDLISEVRMSEHRQHHRGRHRRKSMTNGHLPGSRKQSPVHKQAPDRFRRPSQVRARGGRNRIPDPQNAAQDEEGRLMPGSSAANQSSSQDRSRLGSLSPALQDGYVSDQDACSIRSTSQASFVLPKSYEDEIDEDEAAEQDIEEIWFPGCHADLGGGWPLANGEESPLSHGPLVWMVREAQKAGIDFVSAKMHALKCCDDNDAMSETDFSSAVPQVQITEAPDLFRSQPSEHAPSGWVPGLQPEARVPSEFHQRLHFSATKGVLHDCLEFNGGLGMTSVLSWKIMEYLPFRRMDLTPEGSWRAISWPLPMGEVRDIPEGAKIHNSAIRRMKVDERYRPGNLIIGGGGRGVRKAPKEMGIGHWDVLREEGDPVGEVYVRRGPSPNAEEK